MQSQLSKWGLKGARKRWGNLTAEDRFLRRFIKGPPNICWPWATQIKNRYPVFKFNGKYRPAHRVSYMLWVGPIPTDKEVCHACDNTKCVNPNHLFLGTHKENMADAITKGRFKFPNPKRKLSSKNVKEIRYALKQSATYRPLAEKYGVSASTIYCIAHGKSWSHI